jgi:hypothetical protein
MQDIQGNFENMYRSDEGGGGGNYEMGLKLTLPS